MLNIPKAQSRAFVAPSFVVQKKRAPFIIARRHPSTVIYHYLFSEVRNLISEDCNRIGVLVSFQLKSLPPCYPENHWGASIQFFPWICIWHKILQFCYPLMRSAFAALNCYRVSYPILHRDSTAGNTPIFTYYPIPSLAFFTTKWNWLVFLE